MPLPITGAISPRYSPCARSPRRGSGADGSRHEQAHHGHRQRRGDRVRRRGAAVARALPARRPRPHGHPRRLRHRQLRRVHGPLQRRACEELHAARDPDRRCVDRDGREPCVGRRADRTAAVVLRPPRASVRLLHARDADERDGAVAREPGPERGRDPQGDPGQYLPLHGLREHRRSREGGREMTETATGPVVVERTGATSGFAGTNVPRKEDKRLVQGEGVFFDDVKRHGMGYVHFVRSPYAHAKIVSIDVSKALELGGVYGTLTGDEVAILTDPFFELSVKPGADIKDYALAVGRVRHVGEPVAAVVASTRELARDAAELVEVEYEPLDAVTTGEQALRDETILHDDAGSNVVWQGVFDWGDFEGAVAEADHVLKIERLHFDRFSSTPLECSGVLVEYNRGTGQWTLYGNHQMPGVGAIWMAPALRTGIDKLRFVSQDIGGAFANKICLHPQYVASCLLARKLNRPGQWGGCCVLGRKLNGAVQWTEWRTDQHTANAHGNERTFLEIAVPVLKDGTMLGLKVRAIDDCGAFPRYEPLGCIIWAQVTPGCYRWRNIRVDFTQVVTNKSPVSPNRGYSRMQHLWLTEPIIDIAYHELGLEPVQMRKKNYVKHEEFPYETPNGCVYDSGDYARCLDIALDLVGYKTIEEKRVDAEARGKLLGIGIGSTLDSGTNNLGQSVIRNPGLQFSGNNEDATGQPDT